MKKKKKKGEKIKIHQPAELSKKYETEVPDQESSSSKGGSHRAKSPETRKFYKTKLKNFKAQKSKKNYPNGILIPSGGLKVKNKKRAINGWCR